MFVLNIGSFGRGVRVGFMIVLSIVLRMMFGLYVVWGFDE